MNKKIKLLAAMQIFTLLMLPLALAETEQATTTSVTISNVAPSVGALTITPDDDPAAGVQINPVAESAKRIKVTSVLTDDNGYTDITACALDVKNATNATVYTNSTGILSGGSGTTVNCEASYNAQYYDKAGDYTAYLTATDAGALTGQNNANYTYTELVAIKLTNTPIDFGTLTADNTNHTALSNKGNPLTTNNIGNVALANKFNATDLTGAGTIAVNNLNAYEQGNETNTITLSTSQQNLQPSNGIAVQGTFNTVWKIYLGVGLPDGAYSGTATNLAIKF